MVRETRRQKIGIGCKSEASVLPFLSLNCIVPLPNRSDALLKVVGGYDADRMYIHRQFHPTRRHCLFPIQNHGISSGLLVYVLPGESSPLKEQAVKEAISEEMAFVRNGVENQLGHVLGRELAKMVQVGLHQILRSLVLEISNISETSPKRKREVPTCDTAVMRKQRNLCPLQQPPKRGSGHVFSQPATLVVSPAQATRGQL